MLIRNIFFLLLVCLSLSTLVFAQAGNAQLGGIVTDPSNALLPGVTVIATNGDTGITSTTITNESGSYTFLALQPGSNYKVTASLPGFQTKSVTNIELGVATNVRQNIQLSVAATSTTLEVITDAQSAITAAGASVGDVLPDYKVRDLPLVGNNILDLVKILPGYRSFPQFDAPGFAVYDVFAGQTLDTVNVTRDGLSVTDGRYSASQYGLSTTTNINPELVSEIRLILAPVDAELGRGNSQIQVQTRTGTNRYTGSAVWNVQNTALNANTWSNNKNIANGVWSPIKPDWRNTNDFTATYSGPIVRGKTFFFGAYELQKSNTRALQTNTVYTETARQGIFRYWENWNPGNAAAAVPTFPASSTTGQYPAVDYSGVPLAPPKNPDGSAYTGRLMCFSVFGNVKRDGSPFTQADCGSPLATAVVNPSATNWDPLRQTSDSTGYIGKILDKMPHANYFASGDGLNTAGFQWVRGTKGQGGGNAAVGVSPFVNRKQYTIKVDHNLNMNHKLSASWTYQNDDSADFVASWPGGINGATTRRPQVLTATFTSTLSSSMLNEARFGLRREVTGEFIPLDSSDSSIVNAAKEWYLNGGTNPDNGKIYPVGFQPAGIGNGFIGITSQSLGNTTPLYDYADTFSWAKSRHALKFGVEIRQARSNGYNGIFPSLSSGTVPTITGGASSGLTSTLANTSSTGIFTTLTGFLSSAAAGQTAARSNAANLLYFMNASVSAANMGRWINDASDVTNGHWEDITTVGKKFRDQVHNEYSIFVKDDWKFSKSLTFNLGLRYDVFLSPYIGSGFTTTTVGQGAGLFGNSLPTSGGEFDHWLLPGNTFLTGYGSNPTGPALACVPNQQQNANLPMSTCDPNRLAQIEFVGPNTPNPKKVVIPNDKNNFGPAVGFSWQVPWFGEGKTAVRGGYQITYGSANSDGITLDTILGGAPGATNASSTNVTDPAFAAITANRALNLTDLPLLVPVTATAAPGALVPIYARSGSFTAYDPHYATPYTQNITLAVTRTVKRNMTLDVRYVGTFGRKMDGVINLNQPAVFDNAELFKALEDTRAGLNSPLFDQMFAGLDLHGNTGTGYGAVGTCVTQPGTATPTNTPGLGQEGCASNQVMQHGSAQLRRNSTFTSNLANGNYVGVITSLANLTTVTSGLQPAPAGVTNISARILRNGCDRLANNLTNIATRCFPEDYFYATPQFANGFGTTPNYHANIAHNNYHSVQVQYTLRPTQGSSVQTTYTWAKLLTDKYTTYVDPRNRAADYSLDYASIAHEIRMNGTFELPIGPNRLFFGNASGWFARAIERWQTSIVFNYGSGAPRDTFTGGFGGNGQHLYAAGGGNQPQARPDIVGPWVNPKTDFQWNGPNHDTGTIYGFPLPYVTLPDPQCAARVSSLDSMGFNLQSSCTLNELATKANANTPGAVLLADGVTYAVPVLANPLPGKQGNEGARMLRLPGRWFMDANVSKSFHLTESKTLSVRIDANNILNHANPGEPVFDIMSSDFGRVTSKVNNGRQFQAQLRLGF